MSTKPKKTGKQRIPRAKSKRQFPVNEKASPRKIEVTDLVLFGEKEKEYENSKKDQRERFKYVLEQIRKIEKDKKEIENLKLDVDARIVTENPKGEEKKLDEQLSTELDKMIQIQQSLLENIDSKEMMDLRIALDNADKYGPERENLQHRVNRKVSETINKKGKKIEDDFDELELQYVLLNQTLAKRKQSREPSRPYKLLENHVNKVVKTDLYSKTFDIDLDKLGKILTYASKHKELNEDENIKDLRILATELLLGVKLEKNLKKIEQPSSSLASLIKSALSKEYKYVGPGTDLYDNIRNGVVPVNLLDEAAAEHDIRYLIASGIKDESARKLYEGQADLDLFLAANPKYLTDLSPDELQSKFTIVPKVGDPDWLKVSEAIDLKHKFRGISSMTGTAERLKEDDVRDILYHIKNKLETLQYTTKDNDLKFALETVVPEYTEYIFRSRIGGVPVPPIYTHDKEGNFYTSTTSDLKQVIQQSGIIPNFKDKYYNGVNNELRHSQEELRKKYLDRWVKTKNDEVATFLDEELPEQSEEESEEIEEKDEERETRLVQLALESTADSSSKEYLEGASVKHGEPIEDLRSTKEEKLRQLEKKFRNDRSIGASTVETVQEIRDLLGQRDFDRWQHNMVILDRVNKLEAKKNNPTKTSLKVSIDNYVLSRKDLYTNIDGTVDNVKLDRVIREAERYSNLFLLQSGELTREKKMRDLGINILSKRLEHKGKYFIESIPKFEKEIEELRARHNDRNGKKRFIKNIMAFRKYQKDSDGRPLSDESTNEDTKENEKLMITYLGNYYDAMIENEKSMLSDIEDIIELGKNIPDTLEKSKSQEEIYDQYDAFTPSEEYEYEKSILDITTGNKELDKIAHETLDKIDSAASHIFTVNKDDINNVINDAMSTIIRNLKKYGEQNSVVGLTNDYITGKESLKLLKRFRKKIEDNSRKNYDIQVGYDSSNSGPAVKSLNALISSLSQIEKRIDSSDDPLVELEKIQRETGILPPAYSGHDLPPKYVEPEEKEGEVKFEGPEYEHEFSPENLYIRSSAGLFKQITLNHPIEENVKEAPKSSMIYQEVRPGVFIKREDIKEDVAKYYGPKETRGMIIKEDPSILKLDKNLELLDELYNTVNKELASSEAETLRLFVQDKDDKEVHKRINQYYDDLEHYIDEDEKETEELIKEKYRYHLLTQEEMNRIVEKLIDELGVYEKVIRETIKYEFNIKEEEAEEESKEQKESEEIEELEEVEESEEPEETKAPEIISGGSSIDMEGILTRQAVTNEILEKILKQVTKETNTIEQSRLKNIFRGRVQEGPNKGEPTDIFELDNQVGLYLPKIPIAAEDNLDLKLPRGQGDMLELTPEEKRRNREWYKDFRVVLPGNGNGNQDPFDGGYGPKNSILKANFENDLVRFSGPLFNPAKVPDPHLPSEQAMKTFQVDMWEDIGQKEAMFPQSYPTPGVKAQPYGKKIRMNREENVPFPTMKRNINDPETRLFHPNIVTQRLSQPIRV